MGLTRRDKKIKKQLEERAKINKLVLKRKIQKFNNKSRKFNAKSRKFNAKSRKSLKHTLRARLPLKPPTLPLNLDFYNVIDGVYSSYWVGKLIAVLQKKGKKKIVTGSVYKAMAAIKLSTGTSPLLTLLETLDKVKPTFRLRNRVRRTTIKEYPIVVLRPRQLILAIHWIKEEIRSGSSAFGASLASEIAAKLLEFKTNPKKNNLVKKRNEYTKRTIKAQFNVRYNFK